MLGFYRDGDRMAYDDDLDAIVCPNSWSILTGMIPPTSPNAYYKRTLIQRGDDPKYTHISAQICLMAARRSLVPAVRASTVLILLSLTEDRMAQTSRSTAGSTLSAGMSAHKAGRRLHAHGLSLSCGTTLRVSKTNRKTDSQYSLEHILTWSMPARHTFSTRTKTAKNFLVTNSEQGPSVGCKACLSRRRRSS